MPIVLTRIDNRLVHGQVGVLWVTACGCNLIVVANDEVADDPILQSVMKMTADSSGVGIRFFSLAKTMEVIEKAAPTQKILLVCKTPVDAKTLAEGGVPIDKLNIGNLHVADGKRKNAEPHVYVDDTDIAAIAYIRDKGAEIFIQVAPNDRRYNFDYNG